MAKRITTPLDEETIAGLRAGDQVLLTGVVYTARDAAHKRLIALIKERKELPIDLRGQVIYYVGPAPAKPGDPIGSAGPTTSMRMDPYAPILMEHGMKGMIGKGMRSREVRDAMVRHRAVYFAAVGGAAALVAKRIKSAEVVAYEELGPEAIRKLYVDDLPLFVIDDIHGADLYEQGVAKYRKE
ncbi:MAG TPA: Fe-S-containing hydro-lyase [Firmicutes bacterium]|jgi:fumarate hydratase subunit beta|nr:Fe-S-containing hydro-lyase [Bacillota bacterium]